MPGLKLIGEIALDGSGWKKGMDDVKNETSAFSSAIGALKGKIAAAFTVGAVVAFAKKVNDYAMEINHLAEQYHLTAEEAQRLMKAAGRIGVEAETAANAVFRLADARRKAAEGDLDKRAMFAKYGISMRELQNSELDAFRFAQQFAKGLEEVGVNAQTDADMLELVGIRGVRILGIMEQIALQGKIKIIDQEDLDIIRQFNIELKELMNRAKKESVGALAKTEEWLLALKHAPEAWQIAKDIAIKRLENGQAGGPSNMEIEAYASNLLFKNITGQYSGQRPDFANDDFKTKTLYDDLEELSRRQFDLYKPAKLKESTTVGDMFRDKQAEKDAAANAELNSKWDDFFANERARNVGAISTRKPIGNYSDSLLSVGNFLGAGRSTTIEDIAQKQLQTQLTANKAHDMANMYLKTISDVLSAQAGGIIKVP